MPKIKVVIVEDHAVVRQGLKILIHADPELQVTGEAEDGATAIKITQNLKPDVIVMDLAMPRMNGFEATRQILQKSPGSRILVLSSYGDDDSVKQSIGAGAMGYITKHSASTDLLEAIRKVHEGKQYLSPRLAERFKRLNRKAFMNGHSGTTELTSRELEVLRMIGEGMATKEIAERLCLSIKTVEKHRQSVMDKLDIHDIAGLTRYAASKGIIKLSGVPQVQPSHPVEPRPQGSQPAHPHPDQARTNRAPGGNHSLTRDFIAAARL